MDRVVCDVRASLVQFPGGSVLVLARPVPVVAEHPVLRPFLVNSVDYLFFSHEGGIRKPVGFEDTAAVGRVAAETALALLGEGDPSFVVDCVLDAGGGDVGEDLSAEGIVPAVDSVDSFPVVEGVVEDLSVDLIVGAIDDEDLVEGGVVGEVVDGRVDSQT
jgi:hypothetical protein